MSVGAIAVRSGNLLELRQRHSNKMRKGVSNRRNHSTLVAPLYISHTGSTNRAWRRSHGTHSSRVLCARVRIRKVFGQFVHRFGLFVVVV